MAIIFIQSSFPAKVYPEVEFFEADKLIHILIYGVLSLLCYIFLIHQQKFPVLFSNPFVFTILICSLYGLTDEVHQLYVPLRNGNVYDWIADITGVILTVFLIKYFLKSRLKLFR
jgi:VanZ family protein